MSENRVQVTRDEQSKVIEDLSGVSQKDALDDFLRLLRGEEGVETVGTDYLKTQALVQLAEKSSELNQKEGVQSSHALLPGYQSLLVQPRLTRVCCPESRQFAL